MKHDQPFLTCRPELSRPIAREADAPSETALAARVAALEIAVETLIAQLPPGAAAGVKAEMLGQAGYASAEPVFDPAEALRSATAARLDRLIGN